MNRRPFQNPLYAGFYGPKAHPTESGADKTVLKQVFFNFDPAQTDPIPMEDLEYELAEEGFDKQAVIAMVIGAGLGFWALHSRLLYTLTSMIKTLVHELGHTIAGWVFGVPSIPAFDFTYGGGVTMHQEPSKFLIVVIYLGMASLLVLYRRKPVSLMIIGAMIAGHALCMMTNFKEPITIAMGHGFELIFAGIFLYRAMSGFACVHNAERPLYAFLGFLITFDNIRFAHRLVHSPEHRWQYENAKGGGHWMDFSRLANEFFLVDLSVIANLFMLASLLPVIISVALYLTRDRWWNPLAKIISLED